jgi:hypothetical protein
MVRYVPGESSFFGLDKGSSRLVAFAALSFSTSVK